MKKIGENTGDWQKDIFKDLAFIKQNLRYPWKSSMRSPLIFWIFYLAFFLSIGVFSLYIDNGLTRINRGFLLEFSFIFILTGIAIWRYLKSLKFKIINSGLSKNLNIQLTAEFLKQKHLLVFHHPDCEDIMQIISRQISKETEQREVLIFIADENRILVNSHFTKRGWHLPGRKTHDKQITAELNEFIERYKVQNEFQVQSSY